MKMIKMLFAAAICASLAGSLFAADVSITESQKKEAEKSQKAPAGEAGFALQLQAALQTGSLENAIALFDSMPASLSSNQDLQKLRASLLISAGKTAEAQKAIAELEKNNSSDIEVKEMKMLLAKASKNSSAKENNQDALFGYGQTSYYMNKLDDSRKAFNKILKLDPNSAIAYAYIGKLYAEDENYKLAEENILKAIQLDPTAYDFYMDLGTYSRMRGKYDQAEKAWTAAIKIDPNYFLAYAHRAGLYDEQNLYAKALDDYRMVIKTNPKYYFAYESLGILAWHEEKYAEARASFEKAYSYYPQNISYPLIIAACMYKDKKAFEVKPFLQKAMKNYGEHDSLEYLMLRLYHDLGPSNAENLIAQKIIKEDNTTKKGKMSFYMGLYDEIKGHDELAKKMYNEVAALQSPMFFEFRLAEWKVK